MENNENSQSWQQKIGTTANMLWVETNLTNDIKIEYFYCYIFVSEDLEFQNQWTHDITEHNMQAYKQMMLQNSWYKPEALSTMSQPATGRAAAGRVRDFGQKVSQVIIGPLLLPQSRFVQSEVLAVKNI
jgi:hypothetical protein